MENGRRDADDGGGRAAFSCRIYDRYAASSIGGQSTRAGMPCLQPPDFGITQTGIFSNLGNRDMTGL
ncbi:MAG: hypothetical protein LBR16_07415, partial [Treponema sp.]|nr:hypothetical protein [Treponema sp.]